MTLRTSFSQNVVFESCPRYWYYKYILRLPDLADKCYAHAGTCIHDTLEHWYLNKFNDIQEAKEFFKNKWFELKVNNTKLKDKYDEYWLMVVNGINLKLEITDAELKIDFDDLTAKLDICNREQHFTDDWKSSIRTEEKDNEYLKQLKYYTYVYYRKFKVLLKRVRVWYLRYTGTKGVLEYNPTMDDVYEMKKWHEDIQAEMKKVKEAGVLPDTKTCNPWCPYESSCKIETHSALNITLQVSGGYVYVKGPITPLLEKGLITKFTYYIEVADWLKKHNPDIQTEFCLWNSKYKRVPIGFLHRLIYTLNDYARHKNLYNNIAIKDSRKFDDTFIDMPDKFLNGIVLRDYQEAAVKKFYEHKIGLLEVGTGGGKTEMAIEITRKLAKKTLFVVDKIELLRQTKKRMESALGIKIGQLGGGEKNIEDVTVATVQTISKPLNPMSRINADRSRIKTDRWIKFAEDLGIEYPDKSELSNKEFKRRFSLYKLQRDEYIKKYRFTDNELNELNQKYQLYVLEQREMMNYLSTIRLSIFDECHKVAAHSYYNIAHNLKNTEYRLGISGTAFRDDGHDMMINAVVGDKVYDLSTKVLIEMGWLAKPKIYFFDNYMQPKDIRDTEYAASNGLINEKPNYANYYKAFIAENKLRNDLIVDTVNKFPDKQILILTKLVDHGKQLKEQIEGSEHLYGGTSKKEREKIFKKFSNGEIKVLISTLSIFAEGIDIPKLQYVINAGANKGDVKTIQILGRILRKLGETKDAVYFDFMDESKFFRVASMARYKALINQGHDVIITEQC